MPRIAPFEQYADQYETWFAENRYAYQSELDAIRPHLPSEGKGIEIGVGSGLFAQPLGITDGIEPSTRMRKLARYRGITVIDGIAENLTLHDDIYDFALMVTTICFLDNVPLALSEVNRILKPGGKLIIALVDKNSPIGKLYRKYQQENVFYRQATFYSTEEVVDYMQQAGFHHFYYTQTIFSMLDEIHKPEEIREGFGNGSFVVVSAIKSV